MKRILKRILLTNYVSNTEDTMICPYASLCHEANGLEATVMIKLIIPPHTHTYSGTTSTSSIMMTHPTRERSLSVSCPHTDRETDLKMNHFCSSFFPTVLSPHLVLINTKLLFFCCPPILILDLDFSKKCVVME